MFKKKKTDYLWLRRTSGHCLKRLMSGPCLSILTPVIYSVGDLIKVASHDNLCSTCEPAFPLKLLNEALVEL